MPMHVRRDNKGNRVVKFELAGPHGVRSQKIVYAVSAEFAV